MKVIVVMELLLLELSRGTSISFGTPVVYESASIEYNAIAFDST